MCRLFTKTTTTTYQSSHTSQRGAPIEFGQLRHLGLQLHGDLDDVHVFLLLIVSAWQHIGHISQPGYIFGQPVVRWFCAL